jgi:hypothetical protein
VKELREKPWVIDTALINIPAGPDSAIVDFPIGSVVKADMSQVSLQNFLREALKKSFPNVNLDDDHFRAGGSGFQFVWDIAGPAISILPSSPEFKGHWLRTSVRLVAYTTLIGQQEPVDRLMLDIPDGYLPKWPESKAEPPSEGLINEAHLDTNGTSIFRNFAILIRLQRAIASCFQRAWKGTVVN